jgi:hypothetical protein
MKLTRTARRFVVGSLSALTLLPLFVAAGCSKEEKIKDPGYYTGPMEKKANGPKKGGETE